MAQFYVLTGNYCMLLGNLAANNMDTDQTASRDQYDLEQSDQGSC